MLECVETQGVASLKFQAAETGVESAPAEVESAPAEVESTPGLRESTPELFQKTVFCLLCGSRLG